MRKFQTTTWLVAVLALAAWTLAACGGGGSSYDPGETTAAACRDGLDNDNDGNSDCDDSDCLGFVFCLPERENTAGRCQDGVDNDGDGSTDCSDTECMGFANCQPATEDTALLCQDGFDNDGDEQTDCADPDCQGFVFCAADGENSAEACQDLVDNDEDGATDCDDAECAGFTFCAPGAENTSSACRDLRDNDGDSAIDCADPDCIGFTFCQVLQENTAELCQDGLDNDGDQEVDCADPQCWPWGFCQHYQGFPVVDSWGETWDGLERPPLPWAEAAADCEGLGGRLPTATELWRNNATSGTGDIAGTSAGNYLWSMIRNYRTGYRNMFTLNNGSMSYSDENTAQRYRCVWPDDDGQGFDSYRCHGDPADPCMEFDHVWSVDTMHRPPMDYVAATHECSFYGASIPSASDYGRLIHSGIPNGDNQNVWAGQAMYWHSGGYGYAYISWQDSEFLTWQFQADMGWVAVGTADIHFRCIGLTEPAAYAVPTPACNVACQQFSDRRSTLVADDTNRDPLPMAEAADICAAEGAVLPKAVDATEMIQAGWLNGAGNSVWTWLSDTMYWYLDGYGHALAAWEGDGNPHYFFQNGSSYGAMTTSDNANVGFRCVWRQDGLSLPACAADEVVLFEGGAWTCAPGQDGTSSGTANVVEMNDDFGNAWDGVQRAASTYEDALADCEANGGRLPTASELHGVRFDGNPHGYIGDENDISPLWTITPVGYASNRALVQVSDGLSTYAPETSEHNYRCVWPALHGDVLSTNNCYGPPGDACYLGVDGLVADGYDRVALDVAGAINECQMAGGYLPTHGQAINLIHSGWTSGSGSWLWMANVLYWWPGVVGYSVYNWSGEGDPAWRLAYPATGSWSIPTSFRSFRCIYSTKLL